MYKVLIVDDEPIIRQGLKVVIPWEKHGFQVCGEASDGEEGLAACASLEPDLAIVDIKMPVMDGLQMVEELKKRASSCKIIILSGHQQFSYAQQAIEFGVEAYVLKPINEDQLIEKITKARLDIAGHRRLAEELSASRLYAREKLLANLAASGRAAGSELSELGLPWLSYRGLIVQLPAGGMDKTELELAKRAADAILAKQGIGHSFRMNDRLGILLRGNETDESHRLHRLRSGIAHELRREILLAAGTKANDIADIPPSFRHAEELLRGNYVAGLQGVIEGEAADAVTCEELQIDRLAIADLLYDAVDMNCTDKIQTHLALLRRYQVRNRLTSDQIKASYMDMYMQLTNRIALHNEKYRQGIPQHDEFISGVYRTNTLAELTELMARRLTALSNELAQARPDHVIHKMIDYVQRNYASDLKLSGMAQQLGYNSVYLGQLFKNRTGEYFNTFLEKVRIERAKEHLDKGMKIYQSAQLVGYSNTVFFANKFKKHVGLSPSEYKEKMADQGH